ncbi:uncharacterized protein LOC130164593 [Seriola aureovittata]|uniref:uncharacterized protein LOC130164593 n=1 Tax=Seriola aureovittata TaxID=2871759 RepID=UPI0024BEB3B2|nr:uncharacterized protein LOC130164593 [Seriola aureovittata]
MWRLLKRITWLVLAGMIHVLWGVADQQTIRADPGETVTLPCRAPTNFSIAAVEWTTPDLKPEYVLFCRLHQRPDVENQHPSFQNRVDLTDREMKDGDVSMILKNVTSNDTGTYECHIINDKNKSGSKRKKRASFDTDATKIIYLQVHQAGRTAGHDKGGGERNRRYGLVAVVLVLVLVLIFLLLMIFVLRSRQRAEFTPTSC